jgi:arylsulfatase A-like enzyme
MTHVMNELIDEALGRVLAALAARGWDARTDVIFTTDHGELQGDFGFVFKGPFPSPALMHLPLVWRPAPEAGVTPAEVGGIVSQVDIAPTLCAIAGIPVPEWMQGRPLPVVPGGGGERAVCTWDSHLPGYGMHFATLVRDGWLCTVYEPSTKGQPTGVEEFFAAFGMGTGPSSDITYDGTEGELYDLTEDPWQRRNRWDDPGCRPWRDELVADLRDHLPPRRQPPLRAASPT